MNKEKIFTVRLNYIKNKFAKDVDMSFGEIILHIEGTKWQGKLR